MLKKIISIALTYDLLTWDIHLNFIPFDNFEKKLHPFHRFANFYNK